MPPTQSWTGSQMLITVQLSPAAGRDQVLDPPPAAQEVGSEAEKPGLEAGTGIKGRAY